MLDMSARAVRQRLQNPSNAVADVAIDLKSKRPTGVRGAEAEAEREAKRAAAKAERVERTVAKIAAMQEKIDTLRQTYIATMGSSTTVDHIQQVVCAAYKMTVIDMRSARRSLGIVRPRQVAMYLARHLTLRSLPDIGRRFGGRDHTTVLSAVRRIEALRLTDPDLDAMLKKLSTEILSSEVTRRDLDR